MAHLLITGGAGFIGSHACLTLLEAGHSLVVVDNFEGSSAEPLQQVAALAGLGPLERLAATHWGTAEEPRRLLVLQGDIRSSEDLDRAFNASSTAVVEAVLHFAGLKAVAESVAEPLRYWDTNVAGSRCLLQAMARHNCRTLVFSSSATLYGLPDSVPITESAPVRPINPYGHTKAAVEQMLADLAASQAGWRLARLRYFNPVGAHPSGRIGEAPLGQPSNLFPLINLVAQGQKPCLRVYGRDWPTADGTGVRDYIHVMDLAEGHRATVHRLLNDPPQLLTLNLGSGQGHSVLELVRVFEKVTGRPVPWEAADRRPGDSACSIADPSLAKKLLGWATTRNLEDMCRDGWRWQSSHPHGYIKTDETVGT